MPKIPGVNHRRTLGRRANDPEAAQAGEGRA